MRNARRRHAGTAKAVHAVSATVMDGNYAGEIGGLCPVGVRRGKGPAKYVRRREEGTTQSVSGAAANWQIPIEHCAIALLLTLQEVQ